MDNLPLPETALLQVLPVAVYMTDADGNLTFYNAAAERLWGQTPTLGSTRWSGSWRLYWPDGRPMLHDESPMARTLQTGQPGHGVEAITERPDRSRVPFLAYSNPLTADSGRSMGAINVLVENPRLRDAELEAARLAAIVSSSDDAIVSKTLDGVITSWNAAASRIFGYSADEIIGQHITRIIPDELRKEEEAIIAKLHKGERIEHFDTERLAKDGRRVHLSITVSPIRDSRGTIVGASKVARDITDRKRQEDLQRTLFDELNHRVKNTLATVQALSAQTFRGERSMDEVRSIFQGRLMALSTTHDHLSSNSWQSASLGFVVAEMLRPFGLRAKSEGPEVALSPRHAISWGMVIHELATNAAKYGALSQATGNVRVVWRRTPDNGLELDWTETGGPRTAPPARKGFGTLFVKRSAVHDLSGMATFNYLPTGLHVTISGKLE